MTIAESLTKLSTDLTAAYDAVAAKGGTVPANKNTDNLADAVDSIPTGGGGEDEPYVPFVPEFDGGEWGTIAYLDSNNEVQYYACPSNPMGVLSNSSSNIRVLYTLENGERITVANLVAFAFGSHQISSIPNYFLNYFHNLRNLYFGETTVTSIGNSFLNGCTSFNQPITIPSTVTSIGSSFLNGCLVFNQPISLPEVTSIGNYFLNGCLVFNQPITIPSTVTSIGSGFLNSMAMMTKTVTIETTVVLTDNNSLSTQNTALPTYEIGITLAGSGAAAWKEALPNRTTSPYRKLILAEEPAEQALTL